VPDLREGGQGGYPETQIEGLHKQNLIKKKENLVKKSIYLYLIFFENIKILKIYKIYKILKIFLKYMSLISW